jgi:hypothetical protein
MRVSVCECGCVPVWEERWWMRTVNLPVPLLAFLFLLLFSLPSLSSYYIKAFVPSPHTCAVACASLPFFLFFSVPSLSESCVACSPTSSLISEGRERSRGRGKAEERKERRQGPKLLATTTTIGGASKRKKKKSIKQTSKKMQSERKRLTRTHTHTSIRSLLFFFLTHFFL